MEHKIIIVGIGPGSPDYIMPAAIQAISSATIIVGSRRALDEFAPPTAQTCVVGGNIDGVLSYIERMLAENNVVVLVSGDPGYYSLLASIKRRLPQAPLTVIPGLSSLQVAFARLGETWHDADLLSMHGREVEPAKLRYEQGRKLGLLTDKQATPVAIAKLLIKKGWPISVNAAVCCRLTYNDEKIIRTTLGELANCGSNSIEDMTTSVMVVFG